MGGNRFAGGTPAQQEQRKQEYQIALKKPFFGPGDEDLQSDYEVPFDSSQKWDWYWSTKLRYRHRGRRVRRVPWQADGLSRSYSRSSKLVRRLPRANERRVQAWQGQDQKHKRLFRQQCKAAMEPIEVEEAKRPWN